MSVQRLTIAGPTVILLSMELLPFETPEFAALLDDAEVWLDCWIAQYRAASDACFGPGARLAMYAAAADGLLVAGARLVAGYRTAGRSGSAARAAAYSLGAVKAPRRETRAQAIARTAKFLHRGAA
jgi:hypothetical protein